MRHCRRRRRDAAAAADADADARPHASQRTPSNKTPSQAYVRALAGEDKLTISLVLGGRLCNLER
jgi:hypothetical protein